MAQALPQPTLNTLAGVDARLQAIDKLEALVGEVVREKARHRSNIALKRAVQHLAQGRHRQGRAMGAEGDRGRSRQFQGLPRPGHGAGAHGPSAQGAGDL